MKMSKAARAPLMNAFSVVFGLGLALIVISAGCYLLNIDVYGKAFAIGMAACMLSGLASCIAGEGSPKLEDFITMAVGTAFFSWLAYKAISP
jgi:putative Mn2+ efflux pump MntP